VVVGFSTEHAQRPPVCVCPRLGLVSVSVSPVALLAGILGPTVPVGGTRHFIRMYTSEERDKCKSS
jgi:hypothetical protein